MIYDEVKTKSDKYIRLPFNVLESHDFKKTISIKNREDALNLLKMTPHYYHIKKEKRDVLDTLELMSLYCFCVDIEKPAVSPIRDVKDLYLLSLLMKNMKIVLYLICGQICIYHAKQFIY